MRTSPSQSHVPAVHLYLNSFLRCTTVTVAFFPPLLSPSNRTFPPPVHYVHALLCFCADVLITGEKGIKGKKECSFLFPHPGSRALPGAVPGELLAHPMWELMRSARTALLPPAAGLG